ncbi:hypothetical protein BDZ89DRAFT_636162 [Hymenopellis radicata]|nr:hypothetical protein BDZ89DRAFT_636162 [Hymenopellis radicata]
MSHSSGRRSRRNGTPLPPGHIMPTPLSPSPPAEYPSSPRMMPSNQMITSAESNSSWRDVVSSPEQSWSPVNSASPTPSYYGDWAPRPPDNPSSTSWTNSSTRSPSQRSHSTQTSVAMSPSVQRSMSTSSQSLHSSYPTSQSDRSYGTQTSVTLSPGVQSSMSTSSHSLYSSHSPSQSDRSYGTQTSVTLSPGVQSSMSTSSHSLYSSHSPSQSDRSYGTSQTAVTSSTSSHSLHSSYPPSQSTNSYGTTAVMSSVQGGMSSFSTSDYSLSSPNVSSFSVVASSFHPMEVRPYDEVYPGMLQHAVDYGNQKYWFAGYPIGKKKSGIKHQGAVNFRYIQFASQDIAINNCMKPMEIWGAYMPRSGGTHIVDKTKVKRCAALASDFAVNDTYELWVNPVNPYYSDHYAFLTPQELLRDVLCINRLIEIAEGRPLPSCARVVKVVTLPGPPSPLKRGGRCIDVWSVCWRDGSSTTGEKGSMNFTII